MGGPSKMRCSPIRVRIQLRVLWNGQSFCSTSARPFDLQARHHTWEALISSAQQRLLPDIALNHMHPILQVLQVYDFYWFLCAHLFLVKNKAKNERTDRTCRAMPRLPPWQNSHWGWSSVKRLWRRPRLWRCSHRIPWPPSETSGCRGEISRNLWENPWKIWENDWTWEILWDTPWTIHENWWWFGWWT